MSKSQIATGGIADSAVTVAKSSGINPISTAVVYRLTTSFSNNADPIGSNLEKADDATSGAVGDVTNSSGTFTFASTGMYYVAFTGAVYGDGATDVQVNFNITGTANNSSYDTLAEALQGADDGKQHTFHASTIFDCVATATHKIRFTVSASGSSIQVQGSSSANQTYFTFIRLGDT